VLAWLRTRLVWLDRTVGAVLLVLAAKVSVLAAR
jgi:threonine efflux protein